MQMSPSDLQIIMLIHAHSDMNPMDIVLRVSYNKSVVARTLRLLERGAMLSEAAILMAAVAFGL